MIKEDYVSFETAKLLKERGFNEKCRGCYRSEFDDCDNAVVVLEEWMAQSYNNDFKDEGFLCSAPTLQMAMKWLREKRSLEIYPYHNSSIIYNSKWWYEIIKYPNSVAEYECGKDEEVETYEQACEMAILYCLNNLLSKTNSN